jgi:hypothetical protein
MYLPFICVIYLYTYSVQYTVCTHAQVSLSHIPPLIVSPLGLEFMGHIAGCFINIPPPPQPRYWSVQHTQPPSSQSIQMIAYILFKWSLFQSVPALGRTFLLGGGGGGGYVHIHIYIFAYVWRFAYGCVCIRILCTGSLCLMRIHAYWPFCLPAWLGGGGEGGMRPPSRVN